MSSPALGCEFRIPRVDLRTLHLGLDFLKLCEPNLLVSRSTQDLFEVARKRLGSLVRADLDDRGRTTYGSVHQKEAGDGSSDHIEDRDQ